MISPPELKRNFFRILNLAKEDGVKVEFHYKKRVYTCEILPTFESYTPPKRKPYITKKKDVPLSTEACGSCKTGVVVGGICINNMCETNKKDT